MAVATLCCLGGGAGVSTGAEAAAAGAGERITISLVTIGPGELIFERFGHNLIVVEEPGRQTRAYNYGVFSFDQPGFIGRFIEGKMYYWMEWRSWRESKFYYESEDRSIWWQDLNLTPTQRLKLKTFLQWNEQPANKHYHYNYYTDNCSTKVRDALDQALGGQLAQQLQGRPAGTTYRSHTRRIASSHDFFMYTALNFTLGQNTDRPLSAWEESFLPIDLMEHLRTVMVADENGALAPLVKGERQVYLSTGPPLPEHPPAWWPIYLAVGVVIGGVLALCGFQRKRRSARRTFAVVGGLWTALMAVAGWFLLWGWSSTAHWSVYYNENLLQFSPLALGLVVLLPALAMGKPWANRGALVLSVAVAGISLLGLLLKVLPWFGQVNMELIALALPANIGMAVGVWLYLQKPPVVPQLQTGKRGS